MTNVTSESGIMESALLHILKILTCYDLNTCVNRDRTIRNVVILKYYNIYLGL